MTGWLVWTFTATPLWRVFAGSVRGGGVVFEKERFGTTTARLRELEAWLTERQVELVAMEATGVYWKPVVRHEALLDRVG